MLSIKRKDGDTLIEVLFAIAVFSFVVVASLALMNQGTAASQRALEVTLVRQQIDAQAETLRFMHDSYVSIYQSGISFNMTDNQTSPAEEWAKMVDSIRTSNVQSASDFSVGITCPNPPTGSFIIDPRNVKFIPPSQLDGLSSAQNYSKVTYDSHGVFLAGEGIWIEAIRSASSSNNTGFIDFHIRACWDSLGQTIPMSVGTIVRLYEPRG